MSQSSRPQHLPAQPTSEQYWSLLANVRRFGGSKYYQGGLQRRLLRVLASFGFRAWLDAVALTGSFHVEDRYDVRARMARGEGLIATIWHNKLLGAIFTARQEIHRAGHAARTVAMISESNDGELIARLFRDARGTTIRGSTSRRASDVLRAMVTEAKRGGAIVATPDGPRGPKHVLQEGVILAARMSGVPLVPMAAHFGRALRFARSWDGFEIPLPFGDVHFAYGEPLLVPRSAKGDDFAEIKEVFCARFDELTARIEAPTSKIINLGKPKEA